MSTSTACGTNQQAKSREARSEFVNIESAMRSHAPACHHATTAPPFVWSTMAGSCLAPPTKCADCRKHPGAHLHRRGLREGPGLSLLLAECGARESAARRASPAPASRHRSGSRTGTSRCHARCYRRGNGPMRRKRCVMRIGQAVTPLRMPHRKFSIAAFRNHDARGQSTIASRRGKFGQ